MTSPFLHINAAAIRTERRDRLAIVGHVLCAVTVAAALLALAHIGLRTALSIPEIAAEAAAKARW